MHESGGWSTRRMSMIHDEGDQPPVKWGEQLTVPRGIPSERSSPVSADSTSADRVLSLSVLMKQCQWEIQAYHRGEHSNEAYSLELLHCAIVQGDPAARPGVQQCLGEIVRAWLRCHPSREAACRCESEEHYIALAFERFWQATVQQQVVFKT